MRNLLALFTVLALSACVDDPELDTEVPLDEPVEAPSEVACQTISTWVWGWSCNACREAAWEEAGARGEIGDGSCRVGNTSTSCTYSICYNGGPVGEEAMAVQEL